MKKRFALLVLTMGILLVLSGCYGTGGSKEQPAAPPQEKNIVMIKDFKFEPAVLSINKGETVTWVNLDKAPHKATGKAIDSGNLNKDASYKFTFKETGTFDYICTYHPNMKGR